MASAQRTIEWFATQSVLRSAVRRDGWIGAARDTQNSFIWRNGAPLSMHGASIFTGSGIPDAVSGSDGDLYLDTDTGDVYSMQSPVWTLAGNIQGPNGSDGSPGADGSVWYTNLGPPDNADGADDDFYFDASSGDVYEKTSGDWGTPVGNLRGPTGQTGVTGKQIYTGSGTPSSSLGVNGDFYYDQTAGVYYQKSTTASTIAAANKVSEGGAPSSNAYTTASWTRTANRLYLMTLAFIGGSPQSVAPTITDHGGLTWVLYKSGYDGTKTFGNKLAVYSYYAMESSGVGAGTIGISGITSGQTRVSVSVAEFTNADTSGTHGSGAIVQSEIDGSTATSLAIALAAFGDAANNAAYMAVAHQANEATTQEGGWTELQDLAASTPVAHESSWKLGEDTSPSASWSTSSKAMGVAVEIKAGAASSSWAVVGSFGVKPWWVGYETDVGGSASTQPAANNDAILVPFRVDVACTIADVWLNINTSSGNLDIAIYSETGGTQYAALGSTASPGTGARKFTFGSPASLTPGRYWLAVANSTTAFQFRGSTVSPFLNLCRKVTSSFPLPSTITPGSTAPGFVPIILGAVT